MHRIQELLLRELESNTLSGMTLRQIGDLIDETSPQKVKHHLSQLAKKGFISYDPSMREIKRTHGVSKEGLLSIPIVGSANCGPATIFADENVSGYLKVSKKLLPQSGELFILRAEGESMNRSNIKGKNIEDGDFIVVDANRRDPSPGAYIVSVIDEMANVKRYEPDSRNNRIVLRSESTKDFLPIFIHEDDDFIVSGEVVDVIKK